MAGKINPDYIRLGDIAKAIGDIEQFMDKSSFADRKTLMAVAYEVAIIGEAASSLSETLRHAHAHIPWSDIIGMRHRIIHGYGKLSIDRLNEVVYKYLPVLKRQIQHILEQLKP